MKKEHEIIFTPMKVGSITLKNRVVLCPMAGTSIVDWLFKRRFVKECRDYYIERAQDGVGLMIPGLTPLKSIVGNKWLYKNPRVFDGVKELMDEIHKYDAKVFFQIGAGWGRSFTLSKEMGRLLDNKFLGRLAKPFLNLDDILVAPDEGAPNTWMPDYKCRAITREEIKEYVEAYARTALLCKKNGVDGVEVHAVHEGYLMDQFTLPYNNHRTDEYGGSFENRYRFAVEVVRAIKRLCGEDYPVSLRYSVVSKTKGFNDGALPGEDFIEVGRDMEESERAIKYLEEAGYDMFNCDNGTYDAWYWSHPPVYMPKSCNLADVSHIKKFTSKPLVCAGRMELDDGAGAIARGELDAIGIARQFLADEKFLTKVKEGRYEDIRPCISCHNTCLPIATYKGEGVALDLKVMKYQGGCALNPRTHQERKYAVNRVRKPKNIAVIGGGISGMEAAIQLSKRGHRVSLYEKDSELGGVFIAAAVPDFKEKDKELIHWYRREIEKYPVDIHLNTKITSLEELEEDEIVLATGAEEKKIPIKGSEKMIGATDYLLDKKLVGEKVAVLGGGLTGCEIAYQLSLDGKEPFVIEMLDDLIKAKGVCAANSVMLRDLLKYHKIPVYLEARLEEIKEGYVIVKDGMGSCEVEADSVINAVGYKPREKKRRVKGKKLHYIGDAKTVSNLMGAVWSANDLALRLSRN